MLKKLTLNNFTVFSNAQLDFSKNINIIIGENGQGKTHLLKVAYSIIAVQAKLQKIKQEPTKSYLQKAYAEKIVSVFKAETLGRLVKRKQGRDRCEISAFFSNEEQNCSFSFATSTKTDVKIDRINKIGEEFSPVYFPTRELLTLYPNFSSIYENRYLEFEETYYDTILLLGDLLSRGKREDKAKEILDPLEEAMGGKINLDKTGRFYLAIPGKGNMEIPLVAEGLRKLAMVARLVATGTLLDKGCLFWDEPEANLNPKIIKLIAKIILLLSKNGIQIFIATHSLFLLRELEILQHEDSFKESNIAYFGLMSEQDSVIVEQGKKFTDLSVLTLLDEELMQSSKILTL
ncbi:AAA family ATPase [Avibacterium endocarditidis]|uniref:AAA family ATPase n=1 Tax=Avibacterium endocarditidis TaxID=380674 RepID=UPI0039EE203B